MVTIFIRKALLSLALAAPVLVRADAAPLTLAAAVQLAVSQSRLIESASLQASAARDMAVAAGQLPDPVLKLGVNNLPIDGEDRFSFSRDFMTMRSVGVMQEFTRDEKRSARISRWEQEAATAVARRTLTVTQVQRDTALAWLARYTQERTLQLLLRQQAETRLQIEAAEATYRGGRGTQGDVFAARAAAAQLEDRIAQAEQQLAGANAQLSRWIGEAATQPLADPPATDRLPVPAANLDALLRHHPQLGVMAKQEAVALAEVEIARANQQADWSVELMFSQRGSAYSNMVSLNVSVPLQWDQDQRQNRELAARLATVAQLRAEREDAARAHGAEISAMVQEWHSLRARLQRYDASILPLAVERTQATLAAYRGGGSASGGSLSAVLEARRAEIDMRLERLRLEMEAARLWAQLNYLPAGEAP